MKLYKDLDNDLIVTESYLYKCFTGKRELLCDDWRSFALNRWTTTSLWDYLANEGYDDIESLYSGDEFADHFEELKPTATWDLILMAGGRVVPMRHGIMSRVNSIAMEADYQRYANDNELYYVPMQFLSRDTIKNFIQKNNLCEVI